MKANLAKTEVGCKPSIISFPPAPPKREAYVQETEATRPARISPGGEVTNSITR